ncbi:MAG: class II aldolase/adducin family protein [Lachnospiraceae bacterium]|nr:class II aldolase/adducin family protein [Lachnospiraceae bacterium]
MKTVEEIKHKIIDIVKQEYRVQMVNMFEGNVSARVGGRIFITPSQVAKEAMTPDMLIEVDGEGNVVHQPEGYAPSSETKMHLEVYRLRPDVKAVVHNHSLYATAFAMNHMPICSDSLTEMNITFGQVPVVPYGTPGTERIYSGFKDHIGNRSALLLANHGVLTFGATLELAYSYAEAVEKIAQTICIAKSLGQEVKIPSEELEVLRQFGAGKRERAIAAAIQQK